MPKESRNKHRKRTKYSDNSSDSEDYRRSYRETSRSKKKSNKYRSREYSSSDSSSSSTSSSNSRSKSSKNNHSSRSSSIQKKNLAVPKPTEDVKKFELDDLYNEKDKAKILEEIESNTFKQTAFKQSSSKIIVDLEKDKILIPTTSAAPNLDDDNMIHPNFLGDNEKRVDKWIKKLYIYRNQ